MPVWQQRPDPCRARPALTSSEVLLVCFAFPFGKKAYSRLRIHSQTLDLLHNTWSCATYRSLLYGVGSPCLCWQIFRGPARAGATGATEHGMGLTVGEQLAQGCIQCHFREWPQIKVKLQYRTAHPFCFPPLFEIRNVPEPSLSPSKQVGPPTYPPCHRLDNGHRRLVRL